MDWTRTIFETIDLRSFSNLWFWVVLAAMWSLASLRVLGIPVDMIVRARRAGGEAADDLGILATVAIGRRLRLARASGPLLVGLAAFVLTLLSLLATLYRIEAAQAGLLLLVPLTIVNALGLRAAQRIEAAGYDAPDLAIRLGHHRSLVQGIGLISIFLTALWGMWHNLTHGVL